MFVLGFLGGVVSTLGLVGLLLVVTRPWTLRKTCDEALAASASEENQAGYRTSLAATVK